MILKDERDMPGASVSQTGLSQAEPSSTVSALSGFDPSRVATLTAALISLPPDLRLVMAEMGDGESCPTSADIESVTRVSAKRVLEIQRALRTLGLAERGILCDVDSEAYAPRGSGYWLWPVGFKFLNAIDEAAAIATEARRAETENTGSVHEGADPEGIAQ